MKITNVIVNEKGNIKASARKVIVEYVAGNRLVFAEATLNSNGTYSLPIVDSEGNVVYVNFDVSVSTKNAADRAKKAHKTEEAEAFDIAE